MAFNFVVWFFLLRTVCFYKDVSSSAIVAWIKNKTQTAVILPTLWTFAFFNKFDVYFQNCTTKDFFFILLTSILSRWLQTDYSRTGWLHSCRYFSNRSFMCRFVLYIYISVWFCQKVLAKFSRLARCQQRAQAGTYPWVGGFLVFLWKTRGVGRGDFVTSIRVLCQKAVQSQIIFPVA